jgi:hypothetical protein
MLRIWRQLFCHSALAANPNPVQPPANVRPDTPDPETSVVSDCREAMTECKAVSEAIIPIPERKAVSEAIIPIPEREAVIAVADRAAELRMGRPSARRSAHAAPHLG